MKQVDGNFLLSFTTENDRQLPTERQMNNDIQELFAAVLDSYLFDKNVESNEVHLILCDDFSIDDIEDE